MVVGTSAPHPTSPLPGQPAPFNPNSAASASSLRHSAARCRQMAAHECKYPAMRRLISIDGAHRDGLPSAPSMRLAQTDRQALGGDASRSVRCDRNRLDLMPTKHPPPNRWVDANAARPGDKGHRIACTPPKVKRDPRKETCEDQRDRRRSKECHISQRLANFRSPSSLAQERRCGHHALVKKGRAASQHNRTAAAEQRNRSEPQRNDLRPAFVRHQICNARP